MTETYQLFLWLQVFSGLLQAGILFGLYHYIYREEFLKYWSLAIGVGVIMMGTVLLAFRFNPSTPLQAHIMHALVVPQPLFLALATMSLMPRGITRAQKLLLLAGGVTFVGGQLIAGALTGNLGELVSTLRAERLTVSTVVTTWFCIVFWWRYPLARTLAGRVTAVFIALHAVQYGLLATSALGWQHFFDASSRLSGWLGATLPLGTAAGLYMLALGAVSQSARAVRESEERYRALLRTSPDAFFLVDTNGRIVMCNRRTVEMFGYENEQDLIGRDIRKLAAPKGERDLGTKLRHRLENGVARDVALQLQKKDGTVFPGEVTAAPAQDARHEGGSICLMRDVSERRKAEEHLRLMAHALESAGDCIVICDTADRILYTNQAFQNTYEYKKDELLGQSIQIVRAPVNPIELLQEVLPSTLVEGWRGELWNRSKSGRIFPISLATSVVRGEDGTPLATVGVARDVTEAKKAELSLRESERRFRELLEGVQLAAVIVGHDGQVTFCNDFFLAATGWSREETIGHPFVDFVPAGRRELVQATMTASLLRGTAVPVVEERVLTRDGGTRVIQWNNTILRGPDGPAVGVASLGVDITEHRALYEQYLQSQKLESIGRLAGGVAHDFNNLLTVINGYSALVLSRLSSEDPWHRHVDEIRKAGERATSLVQQLLAFSRRQTAEPQVLRLNEVVADSENMLRRLLGEDIELTTRLEADPDVVMADPGQMHQVLMNLVVNARDAMPNGGTLTIETSAVDVKAREVVEDAASSRGAYVQLAVTDSGTGMDHATRQRIFEPFYTTKVQGKGTGLGLATVYGIVRQSGGFIRVDSVPGEGSSFRVFLPRAAMAGVTSHPPEVGHEGLRGSETLLVVEDEDSVREWLSEVLRGYGYRVLTAANGREAMLAMESSPAIDLVLTDIVMPGMNGQELAKQLTAGYPALRVIFMTGYADELVDKPGHAQDRPTHLLKPFRAEELAARVRDVLGARATLRTVLVVDDEEGVRSLLKDVLSDRYRVLLAADGKEAMAVVETTSELHLVITDLVMPNQEGIETIQAIRRQSPDLKIIAMSGAFGGHFLKSARALGADATLVKPIHPDLLADTVGDLLKL